MSQQQADELHMQAMPQSQPQQQTGPAQPQPTHNHIPSQGAAAEHHPPSYDQAQKAPAAGQPPAAMPQTQAPATVVPLTQLSDMPQWIDCPFCHKRTQTTVRKEGGNMQIIVGAVLCLVCVCLTCLPCLMHWFEDTDWHCSECKNKVAMRKNEGAIEVLGPARVVYSQYPQQQSMGNPQQQPPQAGPGPNVQQPIPQQQNHDIEAQSPRAQAQQPEKH
ncbi:hypothetical protein NLG97_g8263 [Lecanicillium saksenae]|uniref:Uncharacterized protein n=1 Tax=Lecanicillium saksenae TaxID=468837 RepID=A0ACC1QMP8_9HYPO|nr:hypothetical protein NLG97_g8263 [Lecanicillium saksenae]